MIGEPCETTTVAVQTIIPFSFCSQVSGVAEQSGAGSGGVGLQQSTTGATPHGTSLVMPAGALNVDASKLYMLGGRSKLVSVTSEEINPQRWYRGPDRSDD